MPAISATAPGKIILFGEHAVVYGRPAIAVPVSQVHARAVVMAEPRRPSGSIRIQAPDLAFEAFLEDLPQDQPLGYAVRLVLSTLDIHNPPACTVRVTSSIPIAAGLGSGAAVSAALLRAFSAFLGSPLPDETVSALAYEVDRLHHGTPSGIDNTVVTFGLPVYFIRDQPIQILRLPVPFHIVIGDTGIQSLTGIAVGDVQRAWQAQPRAYNRLFDAVGTIAEQARGWIETGAPDRLGRLMDENHALLRQMGVSSPDLDRLVETAREAGALGAKLSGGGRGGNMIALAEEHNASTISQALLRGGAAQTIITRVHAPGAG